MGLLENSTVATVQASVLQNLSRLIDQLPPAGRAWLADSLPILTSWRGLAGTGAALLLGIIVWRRYFSPISDIPGPFLASFSRIWHVRAITRGNQNVQLSELHDKHGHFVRMAGDEVSVSHPEGIKQLLLHPLPKGMFYMMTCYPDWRYQTPMSTIDPKKKVERSKAFASGYSLSNILQAEDSINRPIESLLDWLDKFAASGAPMPLDQFFTFVAFDIVGELVFSKQFGFIKEGRDIGGAIRTNLALEEVGTWVSQFRALQILFSNPLVTWLGLTPGSMLFRTALEATEARIRDPDASFDILAHWLRYRHEHPDRVSLRDIHAQITTNVGAGSDTVSCALQATVYHMLKNPGTWARAQAELDAAVAEGWCGDRVVSYADAQRLPYLQACIKEGLRIHPPVSMGLPRKAPKGGVTVGDRWIPEGITVTVNPWVMHHSEDIWGEHVHEYRPERWLGADATALDRFFIPWGAGYNSCPGQHVAKMELSKIVTTVVRDYNLSLVDPSKEWKWMAYFTMVPTDWPVIVTKREQK